MRTIAIVTRGNSSEYMVSMRSATEVANALSGRYNIHTISIKGTDWYSEGHKGRIFPVDKNNFTLITDEGTIRFDAVFIAIHGTPGENGLLQGYFDMIGMPYTGCGALCSALAFSKQACKSFLQHFNVRMADSIFIRRGVNINIEDILAVTGLPCFVKPDDSGSSFGITKVKAADGLIPALDYAFRESESVIIESEMKGVEVACSIVKTRTREIVFPVTEIVTEREFFDYEAKYTPGMSDEITPARLPGNVTDEIQKLTSRIYNYLGCKGIVRADFIVVDDIPYFIEVNTVPGMTAESIFPKQIKAYGISTGDLYSMVIEDLFA